MKVSGPRSAALLVVALAGCANFTAGIRPEDKPNPASAYLYGRFFVRATTTAMGSPPTMGLVLRCVNGESYTFRFTTDGNVQVIEAKPSRCALVDIVYTEGNGQIRRREEPPPPWMRVKEFAAGKAYYVGDYFGASKLDTRSRLLEVQWSWEMDQVDGNFSLTTRDMRRAFPNLAALPIEDKRFAPKRPPPPPAPAPSMSPERVARVAPLIKRRYASPRECRRDCPSRGDCLPFRDEQGVAITCVIRCAPDAPCPEGLACQALPDDPKAQICVAGDPADPSPP